MFDMSDSDGRTGQQTSRYKMRSSVLPDMHFGLDQDKEDVRAALI